MIRKVHIFLVGIALFFYSISGVSQIPQNYYNSAQGLYGEDLRSALHLIIKNPDVLSYSNLWTAFQNTDKKPNGKVWDMYSDIPGGSPAYEYAFGTHQCGNYDSEGDCYNREHSVPASWFNDASPMSSDLFHLYPTDGWVNNKRSNYPFGRVGASSWTSTNGTKLGNSITPGYSSVVFEPINAYKGDFARTYFYIVTCYMDKINSWSSPMFNGNNLSSWSIDMLLEWHRNDPVSQKETDRNNIVYNYQNNRNPFIDNPQWVDAIWDPDYVPNQIQQQKLAIYLYPNPCEDYAYVEFSSYSGSSKSIVVTDIKGKDVLEISNVEEKIQINTSELENGIYFIRYYGEENVLSVKKLIVIR